MEEDEDDNKIVEVVGPSGSRSGLNSGADGQADSCSGGDDQADGPDRRLHMICITVQ